MIKRIHLIQINSLLHDKLLINIYKWIIYILVIFN
jgi:hypothetical protein